ncbi:MAG: hypothetical protein KDD55_08245, partial [Bdellovibrionales bacterium]|nr:hypothetical protein [Bdellovibrionales bacterium]
AHALGFTFSSRHSSLAGSAHPRNVTISGTLCDLDSLHEAEWNLNFVRKDFGEAMASVATLARALFPEVGPSWNPLDPSSGNDFLTSALEYYREGLEQYSCSTVISDTLMLGVSTPHLRERIERFLLGANA